MRWTPISTPRFASAAAAFISRRSHTDLTASEPNNHHVSAFLAALADFSSSSRRRPPRPSSSSSPSTPNSSSSNSSVRSLTVLLGRLLLRSPALLDSAYALLLSMSARPDPAARPDAVAFSALVAALCRFGRLHEAWGVLDLMLDLRLRPSLPAYTSLLRLYCSRRQLPQAQALLSTLPSLGYRLDVVAHTVFLDGLCAAGRFRDVEKLLAQSRADGLRPTIETLNILFDCLCRESKVSEAKRLLEGSDALGWVVDSFFYNTLMSRLFDVGELDAVLELLASMFKKGIPPDACTFTVVIRTLCKSGKLAEARNVVERGGSFVASDVVMFNTLLHGFYAAGNVEEVRLVYEEMLGKSVVPNNFTYCIVMDSFCRRGKFLEATSFLLGSSAEDGFSLDLGGVLRKLGFL
ncbi:pentatricopeptide repeat-containing protein At1g09900-like [Ananas comosus]|uniref:Pentatricopeptide repeat-containing protein At1g09900-like n=1 Tax=Ananas comosus TaxID=4615 RepID=A0A6P5GVS0_ANACO|nr:pentatricopeptide repeat-containing protein At1g09900-like [Ananas comosus]